MNNVRHYGDKKYTYWGGFWIWEDQAAVAEVTEVAVIVVAVITAAVTTAAPVSAAAVPVFTADQEAAVATEVQDHITTMVHTTIMVHIITIMVRGTHLHHLHHTDIITVGEAAVADAARLSSLWLYW